MTRSMMFNNKLEEEVLAKTNEVQKETRRREKMERENKQVNNGNKYDDI